MGDQLKCDLFQSQKTRRRKKVEYNLHRHKKLIQSEKKIKYDRDLMQGTYTGTLSILDINIYVTLLKDWVQCSWPYSSHQLNSLVRSLGPAPSFDRDNWSDAEHSFNSATTWVIVGLSLKVGDTQAMAISTALQAELTSKLPRNLGSTIFFIFPLASMELTQWLTCSWDSIAGRPVIVTRITTPKLYTSLFSVRQLVVEYLHVKVGYSN